MTPENLCYWLQGLLELTPDLKTLNEAQVKMIRDHLGYVFARASPVTTIQATTSQRPPLAFKDVVTPTAVLC